MLDALKNPPEPFGEVIRTHFRLKARAVSKQLDEWLKEDDGRALAGDGGEYAGIGRSTPGSGSSNGLKADIDALRTLMTFCMTCRWQPAMLPRVHRR